jgi:hypothetical protein
MARVNREMLVGEFLDLLRERAEAKYSGRVHQAFVDWYIDAEFGKVEWRFTDDVNDGGIDAVVWLHDDEPSVVIIQSKFTEHIGRMMLSPSAYREFNKVVDAFYFKGDAFDRFLSEVRADAKPIYRKAFRCLEEVNHWSKEKKAFRLITTQKRRPGERIGRISSANLDYAEEILRLYDQYRRGGTPRARPLELKIEDKLQYKDSRRQVISYLFNARLADFRAYLENNDVARLVARNIRYNLGGKIGSTIRRTYEKSPLDFWYYHNGVTIICDRMDESSGVVTLQNPSVINGAQTLYAVSEASKRNSPALVTTRVIVRGPGSDYPPEDDAWLQDVIRGVNTQNRVKAADFWSNEPEQFELQHRFREVNVFYERKRGEWKEFRNEPRYRNFETVSLPDLGKILTIASDETGEGVLLVKRGEEEVFGERHYKRLFPSRSKVARRFERIYLACCISTFLYNAGYKTSRIRNKQRHAFWNCLWLLHKGITSIKHFHSQATIHSIKTAFDRLYGNGRDAQRARRTVKNLTQRVWSAWRTTRRIDIERWTPNNFFKSRFGNKTIQKKAYLDLLPHLRALGRELIKGA